MEEGTQNTNTAPKKSINPVMIVGIVVALIVVVGGFLLLQGGSATPGTTSEVNNSQSSAETQELANDTPVEPTDAEMMVVNLEAGSFYYKPNEIRVKVGQAVKIVMTAKDMQHDFNIDELGVSIPVTRSGNTAEVEFTPNEVGEFEFYCSVGNHRAQGQTGTLIVEN